MENFKQYDPTDVNSVLSDTTISNPKNDSVETIIQNENVRYTRKGYGLIFAIIICVSYFYFFPMILKSIWAEKMSYKEQMLTMGFVNFFLPQIILSIANLMMWFIYVSKINFFERYRVNNKPWPWEVNQQEWRRVLKKVLTQLFINNYCFVLLTMLIDMFVIGGEKCRFDLESFPDYKEIIIQVVFMMLVEDFAFYWAHRTFHKPYFYKRFHKIHHEFTNTVSIGATYAHPVEYILGNAIPTALGFMILKTRCHFATYIIWIIIRMFETVDGHCGYEFSWSPYRLLPLSGSSEYHNFHHSHNTGTYISFFTIWDTVFGTNKDYYQYKARKEREYALNKLRMQHKKETLIQQHQKQN